MFAYKNKTKPHPFYVKTTWKPPQHPGLRQKRCLLKLLLTTALLNGHNFLKHELNVFLCRLNASQVVTLILDSKPISFLCHVGDFGCGEGGWTPVMKMDGNKV